MVVLYHFFGGCQAVFARFFLFFVCGFCKLLSYQHYIFFVFQKNNSKCVFPRGYGLFCVCRFVYVSGVDCGKFSRVLPNGSAHSLPPVKMVYPYSYIYIISQ